MVGERMAVAFEVAEVGRLVLLNLVLVLVHLVLLFSSLLQPLLTGKKKNTKKKRRKKNIKKMSLHLLFDCHRNLCHGVQSILSLQSRLFLLSLTLIFLNEDVENWFAIIDFYCRKKIGKHPVIAVRIFTTFFNTYYV